MQNQAMQFRNIALTTGVTCSSVNINVYINEKRPLLGGSTTVFGIHGWCANSNYWKPFAEAFFESDQGSKVANFLAIDLPGHGASAMPEGKLFGEMTDEDYVECIFQVLKQLPKDLSPKVLFAHSQGGLVAQMLQNKLISGQSSLGKEFGIKQAILLSPAYSKVIDANGRLHTIPWAFAPVAGEGLPNFVVQDDPEKGTHVKLSDEVWGTFLFLVFNDDPENPFVPATKAPSPETIAANGWNSPEPYGTTGQLIEAPTVNAGIFAPDKKTSLTLVNYKQDACYIASEHKQLFSLLTGIDDIDSSPGFIVIDDPNAGHECHCIIPQVVVNALSGVELGS